MLCHLYVALLVPYTAVPSVRCTVGAIHCSAICAMHCWCHTLLCHLYGVLLVPYIAVPSVTLYSELSCLSVSTVLLSAVLSHSIPTFFKSRQNLTHFHTTYCCPQNGGSFIAVLYRNVECNLNCFCCCTLHKGSHLSSLTAGNLRIQVILYWSHYTN